jgi:cyclopropane-fatty-acyl-phospholipid synthase
MLNQILINQVRQRLEALSLPLAVELWNGERVATIRAPQVVIRVHKPASLKALVKPALGTLARAYVNGSIDLVGDIRDILSVGDSLCHADMGNPRQAPRKRPWWKRRAADERKNIQYHYDVSNDFYALWLDTRRVYSCAYFSEPAMTLDAAQIAKLDHICRKLDLHADENFLDIGCGWGGLILHAAETYGVRATGITLSQEQHDYVNEQILARNLGDRVDVRLMNFRDMPDTAQYNKIASVGMFEHVGRAHMKTYFDKINALLTPGGLVLNHGITSAALDTGGLGGGIAEFIDEYVFPGGELLHVSEVMRAASLSELECLDAENLRPHYGHTLWHWVARLEANAADARGLIGEQKYRIWRVYMAGSAYAFDHGWMELWQVLAGKPVDGGQPAYPFQRGYQYR